MKMQHRYDNVHQIVAQIGYQDTSGWWQSTTFGWSQPGSQYADFAITAYADPTRPCPWGFTHAFSPHQIELAQAESILKVLRKIKRGLDRADTDRGYVPEGHFHDYIIRITTALGLDDYRVPIVPAERTPAGPQFRRVTGAGLQHWIHEQVRTLTPTH
ncbi:hypothetical protein [Kineosporia sp. NBRC 101731]|uniref:hypothetical protein n=1 Tax=Kineosporia sp. NBRC 101731 TaxID=3032199 RepID=UPI002552C290|nr:hypothetical protein [Kineosporia sp. NBRC 101731]